MVERVSAVAPSDEEVPLEQLRELLVEIPIGDQPTCLVVPELGQRERPAYEPVRQVVATQ